MAKTPRYREIADDLRRRLGEGEFPVGTALPPIANLMAEYQVDGLNTIRGAHAVLREEGLIETTQGKGTFVTALPPVDVRKALRTDVSNLQDTLDQAQAALSRITHLMQRLDQEEAA
ncbi:winged helix-turn-helix domain-containing protein [Streptomyces sp. NPDC005373]|uniref:winged helix-turn-helix domain-containing protein n=1 Tax=Streptomyces sp. NPDC005373 TaxID=3156879 RepID=UPI0033A0BD17